MSRAKPTFLILLMLGTLGLLAMLLGIGHTLYQSPGISAPVTTPKEFHMTGLLLAVLTIVGAAKATGRLIQKLGQPAVMGELVAGILLGPSLLGKLAPELSAALFPASLLEVLQYLSQLGIILFMFLVGVEFDSRSLRQKSGQILAISLSSMAVPFLLGVGLALYLFESHAPAGVDYVRFSLFLGAAMSVTAFPVLVRILKDLKLEDRGFAQLAISCAALDDALAWGLLALVVGISQGDVWQVTQQFAGLALFLGIQYAWIRPVIAWMEKRVEHKGLHGETVPLLFCLVFLSAIITEKLGVHALFGAFVLGSLVSKESRLAHEIHEKTATLLNVLFIPLFFAQAGLKTEIGILATPAGLGILVLVVLLASFGKIGGTFLGSAYDPETRKEAWPLSILMNTRGLMEIIVLSLGLQLGIIDNFLFTIFVSMAIITTLMTGPLLTWFLKRASI